MTDNNIDVNIVPVRNGAKRVVVSYYNYSRKDKKRMSSQKDYLYQKIRSIYSKTFTRQRPTNYIIMPWINMDGRGVIQNINQKQNYVRC